MFVLVATLPSHIPLLAVESKADTCASLPFVAVRSGELFGTDSSEVLYVMELSKTGKSLR